MKLGKNINKDLTQHLKDASVPLISLIRNGLHGKVVVNKSFLKKGKQGQNTDVCQMAQELG